MMGTKKWSHHLVWGEMVKRALGVGMNHIPWAMVKFLDKKKSLRCGDMLEERDFKWDLEEGIVPLEP